MHSHQNFLTHHFQSNNSSITVAQQGAHLLSWIVDGQEQLYLSPLAATDGVSPIRGGVPLCFPQFNMRGSLPKHGFARTLPWALISSDPNPCFELVSSEQTRALWPFDFVMRLSFEFAAGSLRMVWTVRNTGGESLAFTGALHTYLRVADLASVGLAGLQGQTCWDSLVDKTFTEPRNAITFDAEFDRVFDAPKDAMSLKDGTRCIEISQSESLAHTVVWNAHAQLCQQIPDLPDDAYQHYLCVEAAQVFAPIAVAAGDTWKGWQSLRVVSN